ncbi:MAG TPA: transglycosylase family protein [Candidatus Limnocylindrales bacterium]|nr:transglycosylase family protein [Candidatus Limnocylindrales bacterium]
MPEVAGRTRAVIPALIAAVLLVGLVGPATTEAVDPPNIDRFMAALGAVESNGRYDAVNSTSGALGKYQILPSNWRAWSQKYLGNADAAPTPANQEAVARAKLIALYTWLGDWASVAHWWLTGNGSRDPATWSDSSYRYTNKILALMGAPLLPARRGVATPAQPARPAITGTVFDESNLAIDFSGGWGQAQYAGYNGGQVRYAIAPRATVWFEFSGTSIAWIGPKGPTRGQANVWIDETLVATVDVYASRFRARSEIFSMTFDRKGTRRITIEVVGTPGRETIAVDEFVVGG